MKKFTKAVIEGQRTHFRNQRFQEVEVTLGDLTFSYFVIPQSQEPRLPNFVMRLTGEPDDGYVIGVSGNIEERFRPYAVAHEFIEFIRIGIDTPNRCVRALEEELKLVPGDIKQDYIRMRTGFFRELIPYCEGYPNLYSEEDLNQFRQNLITLERLAK